MCVCVGLCQLVYAETKRDYTHTHTHGLRARLAHVNVKSFRANCVSADRARIASHPQTARSPNPPERYAGIVREPHSYVCACACVVWQTIVVINVIRQARGREHGEQRHVCAPCARGLVFTHSKRRFHGTVRR